jgi:hypothetical protein
VQCAAIIAPYALFKVKVLMRFALALLMMLSTNAFGLSGGYYFGHSKDKHHFELGLDGEYLGQTGSFITIRMDIRIKKNGYEKATTNICLFIYNPDNHEEDRIECAEDSNSPLSGLIYLRNKKLYRKSHGAIHEMICVKGCTNKAPKTLRQTTEEDNC